MTKSNLRFKIKFTHTRKIKHSQRDIEGKREREGEREKVTGQTDRQTETEGVDNLAFKPHSTSTVISETDRLKKKIILYYTRIKI